MKKLLISIVILLFVCGLIYSQDTEPTPLKFNYIINGNNIINQPFSSEYFQQKKFSLGAQWGAHSRMMKALDMNVNHGWQPHKGWTDSIVVSIADPNDSMKYIWYGSDFYDCRAFVFKPTLYIPIDRRGELITQDADPIKSVFGFSYLRDSNQVLSNPNNTRYNLYRDSTNYIDSVALEKVWVDEGYKLITTDTTTIRNGKQWIFSINLRRLDPKAPVILDDPVLTIRLPYTFREKAEDTILDHGMMKFSTKPSYSILDTVRLKYREDRGFALQDTSTDKNYFVITNRMLPNKQFVDNTGRQDITINAMFICNDPLFNNPLIKSSDKGAGINNIDVQITYHGKSDVGINYCRISTPQGYDMLVGKQDSLIQDWFQYHINVVQSGGYDLDGFYGRDEYAEDRFAEQRYKSLLLNKCVISEGAGFHLHNYYVAQENYNVEPLAVWAPSGHFREHIHAPYFNSSTGKSNLIQKYRLNFGSGYLGYRTFDSLNSSYETDMSNHYDWKDVRQESLDADGFQYYLARMFGDKTTQTYIEWSTRYRFYLQPNYLYGDRYWWANNFPVGNWGVNDNYAHLGNARPHTGEEVRWMLWSSILMGAKGLFYDARCDSLRDNSSNDTGGFLNNIPQKNKYDTMPLDSLIFSDDPAFGVDFIPEIDSAMYIHNYINLDSTAKYLGVPKNRIYYGRKSPKIEMYNLHKWIRANDSLLMSLRLVSAFSKGYRIWRSADTSRFVDTIMNNYIKLDDRIIIHDGTSGKTLASDFGITTRPINRELDNEPYYEPYDSSFFDIALHRFKDDEDLSSGNFVLSVLNRRTDPLVYFTEVEDDEHMLFLTPSEFDKLCELGGKNPMRPDGASYPDTLWQSYYWKRLGAREITIPIASPTGVYQNGVYSVEARELGVEHYDELMFTYSEPYYHRIDTTVPVGGAIVSKYLPGQGKMIECKINSVFSDVNSDCPVCETINDFEHFNVILESKGKIYDRCCYDIKIQNLASCTGGIVPIKLISNTTGEILIDNSAFEDEDGNKVANTQYNLQNSGDFLLGELCVMESPEPITFEIVVGSTVDWVFYGCDRKFKFVLNCESDTTDANNCCDLFDVVSTYVPPGNPPIACATKLEINNTSDNNCISSILFDQYSNGKNIDSITVDSIYASSGIYLLKTIYIPLALCAPGSTPIFSKDATLEFLGSDGEIICKKEVPIYYCCDVIVDPGPINPHFKLSNDNFKNLEINNEVQLEIVPNPNFGYAKLGIESKYATIGTIKILSLTGEIVKDFSNISVKAGREEIDLNLIDVSSGSYYLIFESEYGISSLNIIKLQ